MARISTVIATSHSPFLFQPLEWWNATRKARPPNATGKMDSEAENTDKRRRTDEAFARLRAVFRAAKPDVMVVFGDDQEEQFELKNFPPFAVYVGGAFSGYRTVGYTSALGIAGPREMKPKTFEHWAEIDARPDFAKHILMGMMGAGFDPAFMMGLPDEEEGMGHAFMRPASKLTEDRLDVPMVPVMVNCYYAPQPSAVRCVEAGRAVRKAIESWPENLSVAVVGSGGLWHVPGAPDAYIDEEFDQAMLDGVRRGDADAMAHHFDTWKPPQERAHLRCFSAFSGGTGMPGGIGSGTGETRNWIMANAVAGRPGTVVDYIPVYASPCGMGFAYWDM